MTTKNVDARHKAGHDEELVVAKICPLDPGSRFACPG
jgi:hypothetical protein